MKNWFEVDTKGLRELQAGKPKSHVVRELIQNAFDEAKRKVLINLHYLRGTLTFTVNDDGVGFKDIKDAYTLFANTYKRPDPTKRGRFNIGEKQAFAVCSKAIIHTTSGTIVFDDTGRHRKNISTEIGTTVQVVLTKVSKEEYQEIKEFISLLIPPDNVELAVSIDDADCEHLHSSIRFPTIPHFEQFNASLETELLENDAMVVRKRPTDVELIMKEQTGGKSYLYEMGIPVCEIQCEYSINVQQRIPMSMDRDKVSERYMKELFAFVLNEMHELIIEDKASDTWVRVATTSKNVSKEALQSVKVARYGENVAIANPFDPQSIDEAISDGCRVVYGSEMSKEEWEKFKDAGLMQTTTELYGHGIAENTRTLEKSEYTDDMVEFEKLCHRIAVIGLGFDVRVLFVDSDATHDAWYGDRTVFFNVRRLKPNWFDQKTDLAKRISMIIHELGHCGDGDDMNMHTEQEYHQALTNIAGKVIRHVLLGKGW